MKVNKRFKKLSLILFATLILMIASGFLFAMLKKEDDSVKITIAVPQSEFVQNFDTNYYTGWLREKTGYEIEFVTISDGYEEDEYFAPGALPIRFIAPPIRTAAPFKI